MDTTDRRATRKVVTSEQGRLDADAASERRIREREANLALTQKKREGTRHERNAKDAARRGKRRQRMVNRKAWIDARVDYVRNNAAGTFSSVVYGSAVTGAVYGQMTAGWAWYIGAPIAVALEGFTLAMALTAHQQRLQGERALVARCLTWVAALVAATINYTGHDGHQAVVLAVLSLLGIVVWEIRSGAKHRETLRGLDMIPVPRPRLGVWFWLRYRREAFWAWSASIANPNIRTRADAVTAGLRMRELRDTQRDRAVRAKVARRVALKAAKKGDHGVALTALRGLADVWSVPMGLPTAAPLAHPQVSGSVAAEIAPVTDPVLSVGPSVRPASSGNGPNHGAETDRVADRPALPMTDRKETAGAVHADRPERTSAETGARTVRRTTSRTAPETTNVRSIATPTDRQLKVLRKRFPDRVPTAGEIKTELGINSQSRALELRTAIKAEREGSQEATR